MDKIKNEDDTYENELNNQKIKECACETEGKRGLSDNVGG